MNVRADPSDTRLCQNFPYSISCLGLPFLPMLFAEERICMEQLNTFILLSNQISFKVPEMNSQAQWWKFLQEIRHSDKANNNIFQLLFQNYMTESNIDIIIKLLNNAILLGVSLSYANKNGDTVFHTFFDVIKNKNFSLEKTKPLLITMIDSIKKKDKNKKSCFNWIYQANRDGDTCLHKAFSIKVTPQNFEYFLFLCQTIKFNCFVLNHYGENILDKFLYHLFSDSVDQRSTMDEKDEILDSLHKFFSSHEDFTYKVFHAFFNIFLDENISVFRDYFFYNLSNIGIDLTIENLSRCLDFQECFKKYPHLYQIDSDFFEKYPHLYQIDSDIFGDIFHFMSKDHIPASKILKLLKVIMKDLGHETNVFCSPLKDSILYQFLRCVHGETVDESLSELLAFLLEMDCYRQTVTEERMSILIFNNFQSHSEESLDILLQTMSDNAIPFPSPQAIYKKINAMAHFPMTPLSPHLEQLIGILIKHHLINPEEREFPVIMDLLSSIIEEKNIPKIRTLLRIWTNYEAQQITYVCIGENLVHYSQEALHLLYNVFQFFDVPILSPEKQQHITTLIIASLSKGKSYQNLKNNEKIKKIKSLLSILMKYNVININNVIHIMIQSFLANNRDPLCYSVYNLFNIFSNFKSQVISSTMIWHEFIMKNLDFLEDSLVVVQEREDSVANFKTKLLQENFFLKTLSLRVKWYYRRFCFFLFKRKRHLLFRRFLLKEQRFIKSFFWNEDLLNDTKQEILKTFLEEMKMVFLEKSA